MSKVKNSKENIKKCICARCPSYNDCMNKNKDILFCATGKAKCDFIEKGCICGGCIVHSENRLDNGYYCKIGAAK